MRGSMSALSLKRAKRSISHASLRISIRQVRAALDTSVTKMPPAAARGIRLSGSSVPSNGKYASGQMQRQSSSEGTQEEVWDCCGCTATRLWAHTHVMLAVSWMGHMSECVTAVCCTSFRLAALMTPLAKTHCRMSLSGLLKSALDELCWRCSVDVYHVLLQ